MSPTLVTEPAPPAPTRTTLAVRALLFALSALPLGAVALAVLVAGWALSLALVITPLVVPVLIGFGTVVLALGSVEAGLANRLLGTRTGAVWRRRGVKGFWQRGAAVLGDGTFWRAQAYLLLRVFVGWPLALLELALLGAALEGLLAPLYYRWLPQGGGEHGIDLGFWSVDTLYESLLLVPVGAALLVAGVALLFPIAGAWGRIAAALLPPKDGDALVDRQPRPAFERRRDLLRHALATAALSAAALVLWAVTTRGYFWPFWVAMPLGAILAGHALVELLESDPRLWRRRRMTRALATHLGVSTIVFTVLVSIWAATTRWYFWPIWPLLGLTLLALGHWAIVLTQRIEHLETARSGSVRVQETDLRRIERDLHDGAQARLVALGMNLGLAEQKFDADPAGARALVTEARDGVGDALRELRDLVRGIRPPVLADRGLEAAIEALADSSPLPVGVSADIGARPEDSVETAAYFVVAEALTNAAKHARATRVDVRLERRGPMLRVEVVDDGRGEADAAGAGLTGLRQRVEALDGNLTVSSPSGGPTTVRAELPCGR